jgi:hypothetical protein
MRSTGRGAGWSCLIAAAALILLSAGGAIAQGGLAAPAEAPPPGFAGDRYVDSRGCTFIRARLAEAESWVPLLRADRSQVCGEPPSADRAEPSPAPSAAPSPEPVRAAAPVATRPPVATQRAVQQPAAATTRPARQPRSIRAAPDWSRGFVQVAAFAVPANAARTEARFLQMGLPALQRPARGRGRLLHLVQIGPLDGEALRAALLTARDAGFWDAYVIR